MDTRTARDVLKFYIHGCTDGALITAINIAVEIMEDEIKKQDDYFERYVNKGWILCSDKLPDESCYVLVSYDDISAIPEVMHYNNLFGYEGFHDLYSGKIFDNVIAWMPLPEPPGK